MLSLTPRQQFMINKLLEDDIFIKDICNELNVSNRTILREVSSINKVLKTYKISISNYDNMRLHISGEKQNIDRVSLICQTIPKAWLFNREQREVIITCELLMSKVPIKASYFSKKFNVVMGSISFDLDNIEKLIAKEKLQLIKKRSYGLSIKGSEWNKRNMLIKILFAFKPFESFLSFIYGEKHDYAIKTFLNMVFGSDVILLVNTILDDVDLSCLKMDDVRYFILFIQFLIVVNKTKNNENIILPDKIKEKVYNLKSYEMMKKIDIELNKNSIYLPEDEIVYLSLYLGNYKSLNQNNLIKSDIDLKSISKELIEEVGKRLNINITDDLKLIKNLSQHLKQSIAILNIGMEIINPLIGEIKQQYDELFYMINDIGRFIFSRYNIILPEDEIGYITIYIYASIQMKEEFLKKLKVLVLCPGGIATARILYSKIRCSFPDIGKVEIGSLQDINNSSYIKDFDLILSTVSINNKEVDNLLVVSYFLIKEDLDKINNFIFNYKYKNNKSDLIISKENQESKYTSKESEMIDSIIRNLRVKTAYSCSFHDLIDFITQDLYDGGVTEHKEEIKKVILEREKLGNVVIPNTNIALIHARSNKILTPFVGVYRVKKELYMDSVGFSLETVTTFIVLLCRKDESNCILRFLGKISACLIESEDFEEILKASDISEIQKFLIKNKGDIKMGILTKNNILLNLKSENKYEAIERAGKLLVNNGYVEERYVEGMKAREDEVTTFIGNGVAIPHGMNEYKLNIKASGIVVLQYPDGVDFGDGNIAYMVIGIAGIKDEHMELLSQIALTIQDEENVERLKNCTTEEQIIEIFKEGEM